MPCAVGTAADRATRRTARRTSSWTLPLRQCWARPTATNSLFTVCPKSVVPPTPSGEEDADDDVITTAGRIAIVTFALFTGLVAFVVVCVVALRRGRELDEQLRRLALQNHAYREMTVFKRFPGEDVFTAAASAVVGGGLGDSTQLQQRETLYREWEPGDAALAHAVGRG